MRSENLQRNSDGTYISVHRHTNGGMVPTRKCSCDEGTAVTVEGLKMCSRASCSFRQGKE